MSTLSPSEFCLQTNICISFGSSGGCEGSTLYLSLSPLNCVYKDMHHIWGYWLFVGRCTQYPSPSDVYSQRYMHCLCGAACVMGPLSFCLNLLLNCVHRQIYASPLGLVMVVQESSQYPSSYISELCSQTNAYITFGGRGGCEWYIPYAFYVLNCVHKYTDFL